MDHHAHPLIRRPNSLTASGIKRFQIVHLEIRLSEPRLIQQFDRYKARIRRITNQLQRSLPLEPYIRNITRPNPPTHR